MPAFIKPTPAAIVDFNVRLEIVETPNSTTVVIHYALATTDASGAPIGRFDGDLRPELTAAQQAQLEALALALYARAKTALLT